MSTKHSKKKKSILAVATTLIPIATSYLNNGHIYEGAILAAIAAGLFVLYDYLDDPSKLPAGIDAAMFEEVANMGADAARSLEDEYTERADSEE